MSLSIISMEKMQLKRRLLISSSLVRRSGWSWCSRDRLTVFSRMQI